MGQVIGTSTREVQVPLPLAYFLTQEWERGSEEKSPVKRPLESSDNRPDQQGEQTIQVLSLTRPGGPPENALLLPPTPNPPPTH